MHISHLPYFLKSSFFVKHLLGTDYISGAVLGNGDTTVNQTKSLHLWCFSYNHHHMRHMCSISVNDPDSEGHRVPIRAGCSGKLTLGKGDGAVETTLPSLETPGGRKSGQSGPWRSPHCPSRDRSCSSSPSPHESISVASLLCLWKLQFWSERVTACRICRANVLA